MSSWNIIHQLTSIVGKPWIDLFATKQSYVSRVPGGRTYSVDALATHWGGTWAYAYPPHALLSKILSKIQSEDYIILLIAPAFNRDTSQATSKQKNNLCHMYSIPSRKHCVFMS